MAKRAKKITTKKKEQPKRKESPLKPRKIKIKVIGLGGGGSSIVSEMAKSLKGVSFLLADTDSRVFKKARKGVKVFQFGENLLGGTGTGMDVELAQKAAEEGREKIARFLKGQNLTILIGCLGGGVASGAGPVFSQELCKQKNMSLGIFTLPFSFEGEKKMKIARQALGNLQENLSGTIFVPNERIFQIIDKKTPLKKALSNLNQVFAIFLADLIEMISKPSLINIDFADLRSLFKERGKVLFFAQAMAQGVNRQEEVIKKLFQGPLFDSPPKNVRRILFDITGGKDLSLKEVEAASTKISELNPRAKIIFGISSNPKYKGKIKITLLAVSNGEKKKEEKASTLQAKKNVENKRKGEPKKKKSAKREEVRVKIKKTKGEEGAMKKEKIRRSALEIKEAEKEQEEKEWMREPEWEIPAFLRRKKKS